MPVTLWILALLPRQSLRLSSTDIWRIFGIGAIAALQLVAFYGSINMQMLGRLICFFRDRFFTALIEPLIFRHRVDGVELLLGIIGHPRHLLYFPGRSSL